MVKTIDLAADSVLDTIEIAAAEAKFDEQKVKRAGDGKFAKKDGSTSSATTEPAKSDLALIDRVKEKFPAGGELLQAIADRGKDPAIEGAVKQVMSAYDKAVKAPDNAMRAIGTNAVAAQKSIDALKDYAFTKKDFPSADNPKATERSTQLVQDLKKNVGRAVAAISALLDPAEISRHMSEAGKWLTTKTNNTLEGASKFLNSLMKSAGDNVVKMGKPKPAPVAPAPEPKPKSDLMDNAPSRMAKAQVKSAVDFANTVGAGFEAAAKSELVMKEWEFVQGEMQGIGKAASSAIDGGIKTLSEIDYQAGADIAGKKLKEFSTKTIDEAGTLADRAVLLADFGGVNRDKLRMPVITQDKNNPGIVEAPNTIEDAKKDLSDYGSRVGRAVFGVLTAKVAETVGKLPQKLMEKDKPDLLPEAATGLDRLKKNLGLKYNSPKAKTPLGQLGRNINNSLRQKGQGIAESIQQYGKDIDRNKPLDTRDLGIPKLRDFILTDDFNAALNFKDRAEQLLKGVAKTNKDYESDIDRQRDLQILALEGMRRMQNLKQLMSESVQQSALDYQAAARQRLEAKAAAAQTN